MATEKGAGELVATVEGPKGTAEIYEIPVPSGDAMIFEYQVKLGAQSQTVRALGEAYIIAGEYCGKPT